MKEHICIKNYTINAMDDVVACLLLYICCDAYMTSSAPERFRRSWFWGVTLKYMGSAPSDPKYHSKMVLIVNTCIQTQIRPSYNILIHKVQNSKPFIG